MVETTEDAQAVVEFVRAHNLGRCTCIILEKQLALMERALNTPKTPEKSPRLCDLVRVTYAGEGADKLKAAFYFVLRDTLVCADIDQVNIQITVLTY